MFRDREEAGNQLAQRLKDELSAESLGQALILAIPRGGVIIADKIRECLKIPLTCLIIKKIPAPENEELAIGAMGEGGVIVWEEKLCEELKVPLDYKQQIVKEKLEEFEKKKNDFCASLAVPEIKGKVVIIADDGVATGATIKAAIAVVKNFSPKEIIVAVPVIAPDILGEIKEKADQVFYLESPEMFFSLDQFYQNFQQPTDEQVVNLLKK